MTPVPQARLTFVLSNTEPAYNNTSLFASLVGPLSLTRDDDNQRTDAIISTSFPPTYHKHTHESPQCPSPQPILDVTGDFSLEPKGGVKVGPFVRVLIQRRAFVARGWASLRLQGASSLWWKGTVEGGYVGIFTLYLIGATEADLLAVHQILLFLPPLPIPLARSIPRQIPTTRRLGSAIINSPSPPDRRSTWAKQNELRNSLILLDEDTGEIISILPLPIPETLDSPKARHQHHIESAGSLDLSLKKDPKRGRELAQQVEHIVRHLSPGPCRRPGEDDIGYLKRRQVEADDLDVEAKLPAIEDDENAEIDPIDTEGIFAVIQSPAAKNGGMAAKDHRRVRSTFEDDSDSDEVLASSSEEDEGWDGPPRSPVEERKGFELLDEAMNELASLHLYRHASLSSFATDGSEGHSQFVTVSEYGHIREEASRSSQQSTATVRGDVAHQLADLAMTAPKSTVAAVSHLLDELEPHPTESAVLLSFFARSSTFSTRPVSQIEINERGLVEMTTGSEDGQEPTQNGWWSWIFPPSFTLPLPAVLSEGVWSGWWSRWFSSAEATDVNSRPFARTKPAGRANGESKSRLSVLYFDSTGTASRAYLEHS